MTNPRLGQAFEMCQVGEYNLSQASLTSAVALTALCELPQTNAVLYREITGQMTNGSTPAEPETEPDFSNEEDYSEDYSSDIPIDVIISHIVSDGSVVIPGFEADDAGGIVRSGVAEETEIAEDELKEDEHASGKTPGPLGHGRWVKIGSMRYGAEWEQH
jgi:hypothetical protein